jgi:TRAP-type C4-dicarboxylate transport system permease small subunit
MLVVVAIAMVATICGRYVGFPTAWADETARCAFLWSACFGAAAGLHHGAHFAVNLIGTGLTGSSRRALDTTLAGIMIALCVLVLWATTHSIPVAGNARLPALGISAAWFHAAIAAFSVLAVVFVSGRIVLIWRQP